VFRRWRRGLRQEQPDRLIYEGIWLFQQFEHRGDRKLLEGAIARLSASLEILPLGSTRSREVRNELALSFDRRGTIFGSPSDVDDAVQLLTEVLGEAPDDDAGRAIYEGNLALALRHRYEISHQLADLEQALALDEALVDAFSGVDRGLLLNNLAKDLALRFLETSQIGDLDRSISLQRDVLTLVPAAHFRRYGYLNNLANQLVTRYRLRGDPADLDESVERLEEALQLVSEDNPDRAGVMSSLAEAAGLRAKLHGNESDWGSAVQLLMDVLNIASPGTRPYKNSVAGVADAFVGRYPYTHDPALLDNAVELTDYLVSENSDASIDPTVYWTRATAFRLRFEASSSVDDRDRSRKSALRACELSIDRSPMNTLNSALEWAEWEGTRNDWTEAAEAYLWCIRALLTLFKTQVFRSHKEEWLASAMNLASDAPHGFAMARRLRDAVVSAEQCRAMLLSEALSRKALDLDALRGCGYAELCDRYERAGATVRRLELADETGQVLI
jgi:tetratricopeptide (TPR) repeat protein